MGSGSATNNRYIMAGISYSNPNHSNTTQQYCWYTYLTGFTIVESGLVASGTTLGGFGALNTTAVLKIARENGMINYNKDNVLQRSVTDPQPETAMIVDFSLFENARSIYSLKIGSVSYDAVAVMKADYYPFGMTMPGRDTSVTTYRYGYNGMEQDPELKGEGNSYTTEFRQYDPRLGRWMSLDPLMMMFPHMSPYVAFDNNPISNVDPYGLVSQGGPGEPTIHTLQKGESLSVLAKKYNVSIENLQKWNPGTKGRETKLQIGEKIIVSDPYPIKIKESDNKPGVGPDIGSGRQSDEKIYNDIADKGRGAIIEANQKITSLFLDETDEELFVRFYELGWKFAETKQIQNMVGSLIQHFRTGNGKSYSHPTLTALAAAHPSTQRFKEDIEDAFQEEMNLRGGFIADGSFTLTELEGNPKFNENPFFGLTDGDWDNGLTISVNDVWAYSIKVTDYEEVNGKYRARIELTLYDHFGLDKTDMTKIYKNICTGFVAWYILQWGRGYKPFVTIMNIPAFTITGTLPQ